MPLGAGSTRGFWPASCLCFALAPAAALSLEDPHYYGTANNNYDDEYVPVSVPAVGCVCLMAPLAFNSPLQLLDSVHWSLRDAPTPSVNISLYEAEHVTHSTTVWHTGRGCPKDQKHPKNLYGLSGVSLSPPEEARAAVKTAKKMLPPYIYGILLGVIMP